MKAKPVLKFPDQEYDYGLPPREGEMVEFLIAGRYVSLLGWYGLLMFHSRCAQYAPERVERWRPQSKRTDHGKLGSAQASAGNGNNEYSAGQSTPAAMELDRCGPPRQQPAEGERVEFLLFEQDEPIQGWYSKSFFCSIWSVHPASQVEYWCSLPGVAADAAPRLDVTSTIQNRCAHSAPNGIENNEGVF